MGTSNLRASVADKIARLRGQSETLKSELTLIQKGVQRLPELIKDITAIDKAVADGTAFLQYLHPDWRPDKVKPVRPNAHRGPFKFGERSKIALSILREANEGMTARDLVTRCLAEIGMADPDRALLDKQANSLSSFLNKREGDLVQSDGDYPQKWSVIR